ncbi:MAG: type VI secretion system Vgr family protein [Collimonas pratensis]|uniref:type VI secretion system Vgr family protein n=1 Tax=Collimonas pratensis TaxID=279113 RepID=UPI003C7649AB
MRHAQALLEALRSGGNRQYNRILRLSFPHNDGPQAQLLVNRLDAVESLSRDFSYTVDLLSDTPDLALKDLQGKLFCVELVRGDGSLRFFTGFCYSFSLLRTDGAISFYQAQLGPWLQYLRLRTDNYIFHGKTIREQLKSIFQDYGVLQNWDFRVSGEDPPMTDAVQFGESDHNYVHRRIEARGWLYHYVHDAQGHQLVITDDSTRAEPIDGDPEIKFQRHGGATEEDGVGEFASTRNIVPSSVTLGGFNFKQPKPFSAGVPTLNRQGNVPNIEVYEYAGAYGVKNIQDADEQSRLRMEEFEAIGKHFEAMGNNRFVIPGCWFRLTNHFGFNLFASHEETAKNEFLIVSVHHVATNNYLQEADEQASYTNTFTCIRKAIPWRPGRGFNSVDTKINHPQTATVVGPNGKGSVFTDEYARVRVQFHWDRVGSNDEKSSAFVRAIGSWAGAELGAQSIHRVGCEVVVLHLDGNPDRPIIIGSVYNQRNMPPWKLAAQQSLMGFRSRELTPHGGNRPGGRSNHMILDDSHKSIQAQIKSDAQHSQLSLGQITRIEDNAGRKDARGSGWEIRTDGHGVARSAKGMLITTEARLGAAAHMTDMGETVQRLTSARDQHETLADMAQQAGAQEKEGQQADIAKVLKTQNDEIKGGGTNGDGTFPELSQPHLVLTSPAGIETTTAQSIHITSSEHTAITTGKSLSIASGDSLFASIGKTFRLIVQKAGMKMIAAAGDIDVKALKDNINLLAKLNITHTANRITITAKEEIVVNGGGSYVKYNAAGIEHGTNGAFVAHAASHSLPGAKSLPFVIPDPTIGGPPYSLRWKAISAVDSTPGQSVDVIAREFGAAGAAIVTNTGGDGRNDRHKDENTSTAYQALLGSGDWTVHTSLEDDPQQLETADWYDQEALDPNEDTA